MAFGFNVKKRAALNSLSEEDIRNRLYGSAVGVTADVLGGNLKKKQKSIQIEIPEADKEQDVDRSKISGELATLRVELEQARRRLDRIKGVNAKKLRLIIVSFIVVFLFVLLAVGLTKKIFSHREISRPQVKTLAGKMNYTVQVAVSAKLADAENLRSDLEAKGYKPFIHKSSYGSGKDKFTIYVGSFKDKKPAQKITERLKSKEGIKDSFIVNMPK